MWKWKYRYNPDVKDEDLPKMIATWTLLQDGVETGSESYERLHAEYVACWRHQQAQFKSTEEWLAVLPVEYKQAFYLAEYKPDSVKLFSFTRRRRDDGAIIVTDVYWCGWRFVLDHDVVPEKPRPG